MKFQKGWNGGLDSDDEDDDDDDDDGKVFIYTERMKERTSLILTQAHPLKFKFKAPPANMIMNAPGKKEKERRGGGEGKIGL